MEHNTCDIFNLTQPSAKQKKKKSEKDINKLAATFMSDPTNVNFEKLMSRVNWGLRAFMFDILKDNAAVDECMSRTMENIYYKRDTFDQNRAQFSTWMYKIAYHNCLKYEQGDFGHGDKNVVPFDFSDLYESCLDDDSSVDSSSIDNSFADNFDMIYDSGTYKIYGREQIINDIYDASMQCMSNLPDNLRVVLKERYINKKKVDEIAVDNKIPVTSVKNWLRKGIAALNDELKMSAPDLYDLYINLKTEK